jgi:uncharacterized protein (TIGR02453 family)
MAVADFSAFPATTFDFLRGIAENNGKEWFEANRPLYEEGYVAPARQFVDAIGPELKRISPGVQYEARVNGSISRINRDVRFSRDKRPYKDHLDIWFWHGEKKGWDRPGFYLRITPATVFIGGGMHGLEGKMLDDFRTAVVAEPSGRALVKAVAAVGKAGAYEIGGATRKSVPRGFDASHERARYLPHEGLYAGLELPGDVAGKAGFGDLALQHFAATWPIGRWLLDQVTAG